MKRDILTRPFPAELVKQRQGHGGQMLAYVATADVIARLNEGCDAWDFSVEKYEIFDEEVVVLGKLVIEGTMTKFAFGGSPITRSRDGRPLSIADDLKSAASDALKKSASLAGVALELHGGRRPPPEPEAVRREPAPSSPTDRLTSRQLSTINSVARQHGIGRDHLVALLEERFQKADVAHLSRREASSLLSELVGANGGGR